MTTPTAGLSFPLDLDYLIEHDVWARWHDDGTATVGITALGIRRSGEVYMCRAKSVGSEIAQGRAVAVVELAKAIVSVKSAVTGVVIEVNPFLEDTPELVHRDPYGSGWIARLDARRADDDRLNLRRGAEAIAVMQAHADTLEPGP